MKLRLTGFFALAAVSLILFSCTKTQEQVTTPEDGRVAAVIHAGIGDPETRAHDAEWDEGDAIGLAMLRDGGTAVVNDVYNYHYIRATGQEIFEPSSSNHMVYFPQDGSLVTFRAYYPYYPQLPLNMYIPVTTTNQTELPKIDFMSARHISGYSKSDPNVRLYFYHRLTKLIFKLSSDNDNTMADLSDCEITIHGMKTTGTYHLLQEELEVDQDSVEDLTFPVRNDPTERYGIVMPRPEAGEGITFDFTFPEGDVYTAKMDPNLKLLPGYEYTFYINLKETPAVVSAEIAPWVSGGESYWDALLPDVEPGTNVNIEVGDVMNVYLRNTAAAYDFLASYEYTAPNTWKPDSPVYWENIDPDPAELRASIIKEEALNTTQLPDILIADDLSVARNSGVHFLFRRAATKLFVTLRSDTFGESDLESATVVLPEYVTGGYESNGSFMEGSAREDIMMENYSSGQKVALFQPQSISPNGTLLEVTINGRTYTIPAEDGFDYEAGVAHRFIVTIDKDDVKLSATIVDWEIGPLEYFGAVTVSVPAGATHNVEVGKVLDVYADQGSGYDLLSSFTYEGDNEWDAEPLVYWEDVALPASMRASMTLAPALNSTQLDDMLVSNVVTAEPYTGIDFELRHAVSKAIIALVSDDFTEAELDGAVIIMPGYASGGRLVNGTFVYGTGTTDIGVDRFDPKNSVAIFQPQTIRQGETVLTIRIGNRDYDAVAKDADVVFSPNEAKTLIVTLNKTGITISANVVPWDTDTITLTALTPGTPALDASNVDNGTEMTLYTGDGNSRDELATFTYSNGRWTSLPPIYWESLDDPTTFYASILGEEAYNTTQVDDYLLAEPVTANASNGLNLTLTHAVAQVAVQLKSSNNSFTQAELDAMTITLPDYVTGGDYDNGVFVPGSTRADVTVQRGVGTDGKSALAFIQAQRVPTGTTVVRLTSPGGGVYNATYTLPVIYTAGETKILEVDVTKTALTISVRTVDWEEGQGISMNGTTIHIGGTLEGTNFNNAALYVYNMSNNTQQILYEYRNAQWTGTETLYWDDYSSGISLTGVYFPSNGNIPTVDRGDTTFPWDLPTAQQTGWTDYDIQMDNVTTTGPEYINFSLAHVVSRVRVILDRGEEFTQAELTGATVRLNNFILDGTASLATGLITPGSVPSSTPVQMFVEEDGVEYSALVMPQTIGQNEVVLNVTLPGYPQYPFPGRINQAIQFEAGRITTITVTLSKTEIILSATLEDWEEGSEGTVTIQ